MSKKSGLKDIQQLRKELAAINKRGTFTFTVGGATLKKLIKNFERILDEEEEEGRMQIRDTLEIHAILKLHLGIIKSEEEDAKKFKNN